MEGVSEDLREMGIGTWRRTVHREEWQKTVAGFASTWNVKPKR